MAVAIGASGFLGVAREVTPGTYVAPEKFMPLRGESLQHMQDTIFRRVLNNTADIKGAVSGYYHIEGDIDVEILEDCLPYLLYGAHGTLVKTGSTPNFIYTYTPSATATPTSTLSVTVKRNNEIFGYTGCIVGSMEFTVDEGLLVGTFSIVGRDEATQSAPVLDFPDTVPFGPGQYSIQVPTASQVFDVDTFTLQVEDNAEPQYRLGNVNRAAQFVKFGERDITLSMERDFENRTEYDLYKALTSRNITILATKGANNSVQFVTPASIAETYEITGLEGQGDLVRANISYRGVYDAATSKALEMVIKTQEDIT